MMDGDFAHASDYSNFIDDNDTNIDKFYNNMSVMNYKLYNDNGYNEDYYKFLEANKA